MNNYLLFYLFFLIMAAIVIMPSALVIWHRYRLSAILRQWEARQPYVWVEYKWRPYFKEPSLRDAFSRVTFYQITASNRKGRIRRGWLRYGSWEPYEKQPDRVQMAKRAGVSTATNKKEG